ncbi:GPW/gp25 family protein [Derxia lacustris]|uniref:GPW/gp25 family protein n=1 Tax=Derxia lacustris TaxID=764842 RepID=UPI000A176385|nr:GPW/gp25 family protein [Derxia lacustris]
MDDASIYGRGFGFPLRVTADGRMAWSSGEANVRESLKLVLLTGQGERLRRPGFGAGLERFLFEPNTPPTWRAIEESIRRSLERFEPRLKVDSVSVGADPSDPEAALATLAFTLVATGEAGRTTLSVPVQGR